MVTSLLKGVSPPRLGRPTIPTPPNWKAKPTAKYPIIAMAYFAVGFAFQFGGVGIVGLPNLGGITPLSKEVTIPIGNVNWGILGFKGFFFNDGTYDVATAVLFLFQMVFMDTGATIPTGAMAE